MSRYLRAQFGFDSLQLFQVVDSRAGHKEVAPLPVQTPPAERRWYMPQGAISEQIIKIIELLKYSRAANVAVDSFDRILRASREMLSHLIARL